MIIKKIWSKLDIPAGLTLGNLVTGFISIILAINGYYAYSALLVFVSGVFDSLDGRVARWLKRTSNFGVELDSLADTVSFVIAPTILLYLRNFKGEEILGIVFCSIMICFGVMRLARFNIKNIPDYFEGLPTPAYGILIALFVLSGIELGSLAVGLIFVFVGFLMISKAKYPNFKKGVRGVFEFIAISLAISLFVYIFIKQNAVIVPAVIYILFGPLIESFKLKKKKK